MHKGSHASAQQSRDPRRRNAAAPLRQSRALSRNRPAHHRARPRRLCLRHRRQALYRGHGRAVVHGARLRQRGTGRSRRGADAQALLRASVHRAEPRSGDRACGETQGDRAGADLKGVLLQFRIGSERHPGQARLVSQQRARPAEEKEDHQPHQGLSRRHHRRGIADRAPGQSSRFRPAAAGLSAHRLPASLPLRARRRERRGFCDAGLPPSSTH